MNRWGMGLIAAVVTIGLAPAPTLGASFNEHGAGSGTWVDDDFCGTGVAVEHAYLEVFTIHAFQLTATGQDVLTNLATGDSVVGSYAGGTRGSFSGDPAGLHTVTFTHAGLPEMIKLSSGAVLIQNAGRVISVLSFDGDTFLGETLTFVGRNDYLDQGADFCALAGVALGIG